MFQGHIEHWTLFLQFAEIPFQTVELTSGAWAPEVKIEN